MNKWLEPLEHALVWPKPVEYPAKCRAADGLKDASLMLPTHVCLKQHEMINDAAVLFVWGEHAGGDAEAFLL